MHQKTRVLVHSCRLDRHPRNVQGDDLRVEALAGLIRQARPDLVLLQECRLADPGMVLGREGWDVRVEGEFCLASRLPYGTPVTLSVLTGVAQAESGLRRLGFSALRVRHYGDLARLEVPLGELGAVLTRREEVVTAVRAAGYRYVTLDLEGLRSGNLNQSLEATP